MDSSSDSQALPYIAALLVVLLTVAGAGYFSYQQGYLDPYIEKIGVYIMKGKAAAETKKLQAQGLKAGEDFATSQLKGNQQAAEVKVGVGAIGGLKKRA